MESRALEIVRKDRSIQRALCMAPEWSIEATALSVEDYRSCTGPDKWRLRRRQNREGIMRFIAYSTSLKALLPQGILTWMNSIMADRRVNTGPAQPVAVTSNAITISTNYSHFTISATGGSTNLNSILGCLDGDMFFLKIASNSNAVVLKHGAANILCNGSADLTIASVNDMVLCHYDGATSKVRAVLWVIG